MKRFIIIYTVTDDCTYSSQVTAPVVYDSLKALKKDFKKFAINNRKKQKVLTFPGGITEWPDAFFWNNQYQEPIFLTIDEWFTLHCDAS